MKWLIYVLIVFGAFSAFATFGATDKRQKIKYLIITIAIFVLVLILAN